MQHVSILRQARQAPVRDTGSIKGSASTPVAVAADIIEIVSMSCAKLSSPTTS
jgi:hypothetical protein